MTNKRAQNRMFCLSTTERLSLFIHIAMATLFHQRNAVREEAYKGNE